MRLFIFNGRADRDGFARDERLVFPTNILDGGQNVAVGREKKGYTGDRTRF
jgi:hypothetical protein